MKIYFRIKRLRFKKKGFEFKAQWRWSQGTDRLVISKRSCKKILE